MGWGWDNWSLAAIIISVAMVLSAQMIIACIALLRLGFIMHVERSIMVKHHVTAVRLVLTTLYVTRMISLIPRIDLGDLAVLIYYLGQTDVVTDDHESTVGILIFFLLFLILGRSLLHKTVRILI